MRIAVLHYSAPPVVGGVEQTILYHARYLARAGHQVRVLAGSGQPLEDTFELALIPQAGSRDDEVLAVQGELSRGQAGPEFLALRDRLAAALSRELAAADALIVHNVCTLHKNLALTAALHACFAARQGPDGPSAGACSPVLAWHHDLAWTNPQYQPQLHPGYPWDLLRTPWPGVRHVTVSRARQAELAGLYGLPAAEISVIPGGVDPALFFKWHPFTEALVNRYGLLSAATIFLLPARLTPRKNVELALRILAAYREQTGRDARLIVSGPPGPHNPANTGYLASLLALRQELGLVGSAHFLFEINPAVPDAVLADLYLLADALLFPSAQEGFGIPILEAGLARLPVFCSDIPPLRETGDGAAHFFDPGGDPAAIAAGVALTLDGDPAFCLRHRVLPPFTWSQIVERKLLPLLCHAAPPQALHPALPAGGRPGKPCADLKPAPSAAPPGKVEETKS